MAIAPRAPRFTLRTVDELEIEDQRDLAGVALFADLKEVLRRDRYRFRVMPPESAHRWDRALLLNLTFWTPAEEGDVLLDEPVPADVIAHVAWHHLCAAALSAPAGPPSLEALLLGEAIASAFDVYLVGRLLATSPRSAFIESQVPRLADTAAEAGLDDQAFQALLADIAAEPEVAFEDLRQLLFDATRALHGCRTAEAGLEALAAFDDHRLAPLLHRFELSNWVLHGRAFAAPAGPGDERVRVLDAELRRAGDALAVLERSWVAPRLRPAEGGDQIR